MRLFKTLGFFLLPSGHLTPQFLYSSFHNSIQHDFQAAWFYFREPMKQEKKKLQHVNYMQCHQLQFSSNIWKVVRFSVKYMCTWESGNQHCIFRCDTEGGFFSVWRYEDLETAETKMKIWGKKKLPSIFAYIHSVPLFLLPFRSLFFQNGFSALYSVEAKKEMGSHCWFWVSPSCSPSYTALYKTQLTLWCQPSY